MPRWTQEELDRMDRETSRPRFDEVPRMSAKDAWEFQQIQDKTWDSLFTDVPWYSPLRWCIFLLACSWVQSHPRLKKLVISWTESTKGYKVRKQTFEEM